MKGLILSLPGALFVFKFISVSYTSSVVYVVRGWLQLVARG